VKLPVRETKREHINMLYDLGSTISLMKLKKLKDDALIYENKITLTGITGHNTNSRKGLCNNYRRRTYHKTCILIKDDTLIEHNGILGIDFLRNPVKRLSKG